jgi:hypothetical protein
MKIDRVQLVQVLELLTPGLSQREIMEHANSYCFEKGKAITFNDETCCSMNSPLKVTGAIPAEPLKEILLKLKEEHLDISQTNSKLLIKGKGQSVAITRDKKIELPLESLETPSKWKPLPERFSEGLKLIESCASKDEASFALTCIHLHPKWIEAFDTYQFARFNIVLGLKKSTLVRQVSIKNIVDLEMNEFAETKHWIHFRNSSGLMLACRRYTDKYPILDPLAKLSGKKIQLPKSLVDVADRAEVFSVYNTQENYIHVIVKPSWVHVKGEGQYGWYRGRRKIVYSGPPMEFMVNPVMLKHIVQQHKDMEICGGKIKALKATIGDFIFVASLTERQDKEESKKESK